jgi:type II secretion system protein H
MSTAGVQTFRSRTHRAAAFTLVELLLIVAMVALVGSVGGGMYMGSYEKVLVEKAARQFFLTAKYARIKAIERGQPYELLLDTEAKGFAVTTTQWNAETGRGETVIVRDYYCKPVELEGDVAFEMVKIAAVSEAPNTDEAVQQKIVFRPDGSAESALIQLGDGQTHYTVAVLASTGRASLHFGTADGVNIAVVDLDQER